MSWFERRKRDFFYKKSKLEGYRSRAAYKLLQADKIYHFIKPGDTVADLGCAPGGWLQVAGRLVGLRGKVFGVDVKPVKPLNMKNVKFLLDDVSNPKLPEKLLKLAGKNFDVVLSDLSPNLTGVWEVDHARQIDLAEKAYKVACLILKNNGTFFTKVFDGPYLKDFIREVKKQFKDIKILKPKASKPESAELYILAKGFNGEDFKEKT
ncbi:MAG: RlmE family RNA methyltransferase [Candidatus Bathyarchaeota archaeon]|nr:RlmE family RNA methyltransferase [Candidatus Bathyarchaeota archaeon]